MRSLWLLPLVLAVTGCLVGEAFEDDDDGGDAGLAPVRTGLTGGPPIKAAKWWNPLVPDVNEQASSAGLELPHGLTYPQAIDQICKLGIEALFVRVGEPKIMTYAGSNDPCDGLDETQCRAKIHGKLADALVAIKDNTTCAKKPVVYLMQRQQLTTDAKLDSFAAVELKELLDVLGARGVKGLVKGLALVENHVDNACDVKNQAVAVAKRINRYNADFLKTRSLFIGGAGLGNKFKNLNTNTNCSRGLQQTLADLAEQTASFSFIYKHFDNELVHACPDWGQIKNPDISASAAKAYLLDGCPGLRDLVDGLTAQRERFPAHANVIFWGDEGDGVTNIPRGVLKALHEIFVTDRPTTNFHHVAFDRLFARAPTSASERCPANEDHCKHLVTVNASQTAAFNTASSNMNVATSVFETWNRWQTPAPGY